MKIPIEIQKKKDSNSDNFVVLVSLQDAIARASMNNEIYRIQQDYVRFLKKCKSLLTKIQSSLKDRGDAKLKWTLANEIYKFAKDLENRGFIFANLTEALPRELNMSSSEINHYLDFRVVYPDLSLVRSEIEWAKYRELISITDLIVRKDIENKIISGKLKTRNDIRKYKKKLLGVPDKRVL